MYGNGVAGRLEELAALDVSAGGLTYQRESLFTRGGGAALLVELRVSGVSQSVQNIVSKLKYDILFLS